jgi:hypothetical protein
VSEQCDVGHCGVSPVVLSGCTGLPTLEVVTIGD